MELNRRAAAEEALRAVGAVIVSAHGTVEDLSAKIRRDRIVAQRERDKRVYNATRSCVRKVKHATPDKAAKTARKIGDPHVRSYRCSNCGGWHVGHVPKR